MLIFHQIGWGFAPGEWFYDSDTYSNYGELLIAYSGLIFALILWLRGNILGRSDHAFPAPSKT